MVAAEEDLVLVDHHTEPIATDDEKELLGIPKCQQGAPEHKKGALEHKNLRPRESTHQESTAQNDEREEREDLLPGGNVMPGGAPEQEEEDASLDCKLIAMAANLLSDVHRGPTN